MANKTFYVKLTGARKSSRAQTIRWFQQSIKEKYGTCTSGGYYAGPVNVTDYKINNTNLAIIDVQNLEGISISGNNEENVQETIEDLKNKLPDFDFEEARA